MQPKRVRCPCHAPALRDPLERLITQRHDGVFGLKRPWLLSLFRHLTQLDWLIRNHVNLRVLHGMEFALRDSRLNLVPSRPAPRPQLGIQMAQNLAANGTAAAGSFAQRLFHRCTI